MNKIPQKQNEERYLKYLAAQRQLYSEAKWWSGSWMVLAIVAAIAGTGVIPALKPFSHYTTLFNIIILVGELIILAWAADRRREAASIQELLDCELFGLPWNAALVPQPRQEMILAAAGRYRKVLSPTELNDWYETINGKEPLHKARLKGQKENLNFTSTLISLYLPCVYAVLVFILIGLIIIGFLTHTSLEQFFTGLLWLFLPVFVIGLKHAYDFQKALQRLRELLQVADALWAEASKNKLDDEELRLNTRELQNEIFHTRSDNPSIFDFVYRLLRNRTTKLLKSSL